MPRLRFIHRSLLGLSVWLASASWSNAAEAADQATTGRDDANDAASERSGARAPTPPPATILHRVVPYETLEEIGDRYGVTPAELTRWNRVLAKNPGKLKAGWELKVRARITPPPRKKITYVVRPGDTWQEIAAKHNVPEGDLHRWNREVPRKFKAGTKLVVYTNPKPSKVREVVSTEPMLGATALGVPSVRAFDVPAGGVSIGSPNRGRLSGGVQLPESDLYTVRRPEESFGSSHTIRKIQEAIASFRDGTGYDRELVIGAISLERGGRFRPHRSHQSGRDVDIRLPKRAGADPKSNAPADIDWDAAWKLVTAFIETGDAEYIFLDYSRQKRLYDAAKRAGADAATIDKAIQYPRARSTNNGIVRHAEGHLVHIHVRIECPRDQARCED
jgi:murein endopeptidase